ncbi:MAG: MFS transporter [Cyanobacteria bacterium P01_D01_bin.73]
MFRLLGALPAAARRNLLLLFGTSLLFWCSMASLLPTLSLYAQDLGGTDQQVGFVMGSFAVGLLLARTRFGRLADRRGRKIVLTIGTSVAMLAPVGYIFVNSIAGLIALRMFHGLSIAAFTTGFSAFVVDVSPPKHRGEIIGYMTLTQPVGVAIGPALGSFVQSELGHIPTFSIAASFGLLATLGMTMIQNPQLPPQPGDIASENASKATPSSDISLWQRLRSPEVTTPALVMLAVGLVFGTLSTFIPLLITSTGLDLIPGLFYTAAAIASFSARFWVGKRSDRYGRGIFISMSLVCYLVAMLMLTTVNTVQLFLMAGFIEGLAAGLLFPGIIALMSDRIAAHERGQMFAITLMGFDCGIALAGPVLGGIADEMGYRVLFAIAAGLVVIAMVIFASGSNPTPRQSLKFALGRSPDLYAQPAAGVVAPKTAA